MFLIPDYILADKDLTGHDIRLFSFIFGLMTKDGFTYKTSSLSKRFKSSENNVEKSLNILISKNYFVQKNQENTLKTILMAPEFYSALTSSPKEKEKKESSKEKKEKEICISCPNTNIILLLRSNNITISPINTVFFSGKNTLTRRKTKEKTSTCNTSNQEIVQKKRRVFIQNPEIEVKMTRNQKAIVDKWNNLELKPFYTRKTRTFNVTMENITKLRSGKLFKNEPNLTRFNRKYEITEILQSIENFADALKQPKNYGLKGTDISRLEKVSLENFIFNPFSPFKSEFVRFLETTLSDKHKHLTNILKKFYIDKVLGGIKPKKGFSFYENEKFKLAGERIAEFYDENKKKMRLNLIGGEGVKDFARLVCEAIEKDTNDITVISPGWFSSDTTFHRRIPAFLNREGVLMSKDEAELRNTKHI